MLVVNCRNKCPRANACECRDFTKIVRLKAKINRRFCLPKKGGQRVVKKGAENL